MSRWIVALLCVALSSTAMAQEDRTVTDDYDTQTIGAGKVSPLDSDLFGDNIDYGSGGLTIKVTDVSLPGNNGLPVSLQRTFHASDDGVRMLQWTDYDIPYLSGLYRKISGWQGDNTQDPNARCTYGQAPEVGQSAGKPDRFFPEEYWHGVYLNLPSSGPQLLQAVNPSSGQGPSDGDVYRWVTQSHWYVSCLGATSNGAAGEGFLARSPDGTKYWFDRLVVWESATSIKKPAWQGGMAYLARNEFRMLPSRVEDRFGNWVTYTYNGKLLTSIQSNDGRQLTLVYDALDRLSTVSDGTRTWTYDYTSGLKVTYPDLSVWRASFSGVGISRNQQDCDYAWVPRYSGERYLTIEHPSGAVATYRLAGLLRGVSYVPYHGIAGGAWCIYTPKVQEGIAVYSKTVSGPGIATQTWTMTYGPPNDCYVWAGTGFQPSQPCAANAPTTRTVEVTGPDGYRRFTVGNKYHDNDGAILRVDRGATSASILESRVSSHAFLPAVGGFWILAGDNYFAFHERVENQTTTTRDGVNFTSTVNARDALGRPTSQTLSTSQGLARTDVTAYYDNPSKWILGQVASVTTTSVSPNVVLSRVEYDSNGMRWKTYGPGTPAEPGLLQQLLSYDLSSSLASGLRGTIASTTDARGFVTTYGNWYRGQPRLIHYPVTDEAPAGAQQTTEINNDGSVAWVIDETGSKQCFDRDAMGRLSGVTYPTESAANSCSTSDWNKRVITFGPGAAAFGLPPNHWIQTSTLDKAVTNVHFDAQWRPVVEERYDNTTAATKIATASYVIRRYDIAGRLAFESYPVASLGAYTDPALKGTYTFYDALGRVVRTEQDSDVGRLATTTEYQAGFKTMVTNARQKQTTTTFFSLDGSAYDKPLVIAQPEGVMTTITRDIFGNETALTRSGTGG
ncbi:hypothetical protein AB4059_13170 [Lysobacter sp. 2RAF19]